MFGYWRVRVRVGLDDRYKIYSKTFYLKKVICKLQWCITRATLRAVYAITTYYIKSPAKYARLDFLFLYFSEDLGKFLYSVDSVKSLQLLNSY